MKKKFTKTQKKKLKRYWKAQEKVWDEFLTEIGTLETIMQRDLKIPNLEFYWSKFEGSIVGIGTADRDYELLQYEDLEEEE